ncbi:MAG: UDP-N-acetylglucosamine 2-epimerase (non-hydrolyzing) [Acetomicrobium sp.]|nr:UDP-N-acetylglucosamine 2-epimerase (non-hydrolyzing) [Acetomicrobium sp.]
MEVVAMSSICCIIGTRPEAIKMAPVIMKFKERDMPYYVLATGQHTDLLTQALKVFNIVPNCNLSIMKEKQSLDYITSSVLTKVGEVLDDIRPEVVLVHGDTTTTFASALAAFYRKVKIGHVEAGLRSGNMYLPFPEEANRIMTDKLATFWFAPTKLARENLINDGCDPSRIWVTGNTVVDALMAVKKAARPPKFSLDKLPAGAPMLLATVHRRESWGEPLEAICKALMKILDDLPELYVVVPMHKNPLVREIWQKHLGCHSRVILCDAMEYDDFVWTMDRSSLILTDSGGIQEEATTLKKPVIILRDVTERPEAVSSGTAVLAGREPSKIIELSLKILRDDKFKASILAKAGSPFGEGRAAEIIVDVLSNYIKTGKY